MTKEEYISFKHFIKVVRYRKIPILIISLIVAIITLIVSLVIPPTYKAETTLLMPESTSKSASAISSALGVLSPRFSSTQGMSSQLIKSMLESRSCMSYVVKKFDLIKVYKVKDMDQAIQILNKNTKIGIFSLLGVIKIQVYDKNPQRAAALANYYVDMIYLMNSKYKITTDYPIIRVMDKAEVPKIKIAPKIKFNVLISFLIALVLSVTYYVVFSKIE